MTTPSGRFTIRYRDDCPESPVFVTTIRAFDKLDAEERFLEAPDADGWVIVSIAEARGQSETGSHYQERHRRDARRRSV